MIDFDSHPQQCSLRSLGVPRNNPIYDVDDEPLRVQASAFLPWSDHRVRLHPQWSKDGAKLSSQCHLDSSC